MKPYKQALSNNCFATCIACILERDPSLFPNFCFASQNWREFTNQWLAKYDLFYLDITLPGDLRDELVKFWGWHVISGEGPRGKRHSVVGYKGEIAHDPHPDGGGLLGTAEDWEFGFLISTKPEWPLRRGGKQCPVN